MRRCVVRCVSDVICGCHGDAIDWPTRRQTSRESRRHSDYCRSLLPRTNYPFSLSHSEESHSRWLFLSLVRTSLPFLYPINRPNPYLSFSFLVTKVSFVYISISLSLSSQNCTYLIIRVVENCSSSTINRVFKIDFFNNPPLVLILLLLYSFLSFILFSFS